MNEYFAQDLISEMHDVVGGDNITGGSERSCGDLEFELNDKGMRRYRSFIRKYPKITMLEKCHCDTRGNILRFTQPDCKGKWSSQIRREENEQAQIEWEKSISVEQLHDEVKQFFKYEPTYTIGKNEKERVMYIHYDLYSAYPEEKEKMYKYIKDNPDTIISQLFLGLFFCLSDNSPRFKKHY